jgi:hypothetical protein
VCDLIICPFVHKVVLLNLQILLTYDAAQKVSFIFKNQIMADCSRLWFEILFFFSNNRNVEKYVPCILDAPSAHIPTSPLSMVSFKPAVVIVGINEVSLCTNKT